MAETLESSSLNSSSDSAVDLRDNQFVRLEGQSLPVATTGSTGTSQLVSGSTICVPSITSTPASQTSVIHKPSLIQYVPTAGRVPGIIVDRSFALYDGSSTETRPHVSEDLLPVTTRVQQSENERTPLLSLPYADDRHFERIKSVCFRNYKHGLAVTVSSVIVLSFCGGLLFHLFSPGTDHKQLLIDNNNMVLLGYFDTYLFQTFQIHRTEESQCDQCTLIVYSLIPERLIVSGRNYNMTSDTLIASEDGVLLKPEYFIDGSRIELNVSFHPSSGQDVIVSINVYNDLSLYEKFRKGENPEPMETHVINVTTFVLNFVVGDTGYYFIGIIPLTSPISFQYHLNVHQIYYSKDSYTPQCTADSSDYCSLRFPTKFTQDNAKSCILVYSEVPDVVATSYYVSVEYNFYRGVWNTCSIALVLCIWLVSVCTLTFLVCWCVCCARRKCMVQRLSHDSYYYSI